MDELNINKRLFDKEREVINLTHQVDFLRSMIEGAISMLKYANETQKWSYVVDAKEALELSTHKGVLDQVSLIKDIFDTKG